MNLLNIGINHKTAPVEVRDQVSVAPRELPPLLGELVEFEALSEGLLLSTCNRTEVYAIASNTDAAFEHCRKFLQRLYGKDEPALDEFIYRSTNLEAVEHLFLVISGVDSLALGESQIAGQVREAHRITQESGTAGFYLNRLFEQAYHLNKRVRTETGIGEGSISISHMAVDLAMQIFGNLGDKRMLVLGAGETSALTIQHLLGHGAKTIMIANRTNESANKLADEYNLEKHSWDDLEAALKTADVVMTSTSAPHPVLRKDQVAAVMRERGNSPLFVVDIAAPRDVEPEIGEIYNVYLYNIDDLQRVVQDNLERREHEVVRAKQIIRKELRQFEIWLKSLDAREVIVDLRKQYDDIRNQEIEWLRTKTSDVDKQTWEQIDMFSKRLMNKYLHHPTSQLRNPKDEHPGTLVEIVRKIFNLGGK